MVITATCRECGREMEVLADTQVQAVDKLEERGWKLDSRGSTCPRCVEKAKHARKS